MKATSQRLSETNIKLYLFKYDVPRKNAYPRSCKEGKIAQWRSELVLSDSNKDLGKRKDHCGVARKRNQFGILVIFI